MRHITMAMAFGVVALMGFLALPAGFHSVANAEAALVTGGDCVGQGPQQSYCDTHPCLDCGKGQLNQAPPNSSVRGCYHSNFVRCPCDTGPRPTYYNGTAETCTSS